MSMRFNDVHIFRDQRFSLGVDMQTQQPYLSIPVANQMVDYEEYYLISPDQFQQFADAPNIGALFADECRARLSDHLIILQPGSDRGEPL
jgi:hypothetical protein